ncbi:MAG: hypothetical protein ACI8XO_000552 [Verrucomicrobiales bacterium]|jgi:hypothetical protein
MMNSEKQDPLDANLTKLITEDNLPPTPTSAQKGAMLERLQLRQQELAQPSARKRPIFLHPTILLGAATAIALTCVVIFQDKTTTPPRPIPPVAQEVTAPPSNLETYDAIGATHRITLRDGSTAIAEAGTRFIETAPRKLELERGALYLLVAKADTPLEVITPQGKVLALGTRFLVTSHPGDTRVSVAQGHVEIEAAAGGESIGIGRGEQGILAADNLLRRPAPRISYLIEWARDSLKSDERIGAAPPRNGLVAIDPYGQESRLELREYTLDVYIEDGVARSTIDQTFFNHYHSNTEGTFFFPLPPGAAVSRMAMYVNGLRNEAGMVERQRGQQIYNDIKYANRDPALLEQLEGNQYKLRIFPLEGRREKRIFISFTQTVDELYRQLRYWFPMDHTSASAGKLQIRVRIRDGADQFDAQSSTHEFASSVDGNDLLLSYAAENIKPDQDLLLKLLPKKYSNQLAETATLERDGNHFLHTRIRPDLGGKPSQRPRPRQWFVLNDTSASRSATDLRAQAHIIGRLLAEGDDQDSIAIANLNIDTQRLTAGLVPLRGEAAIAAVEKIRAARRIGATNIEAGIAALRTWIEGSGAENPHIIYLGDGLASDGKKTTVELTAMLDKEVPLIGIAVGKKADLTFLRSAANFTGGATYLMNPDEDLNWRVFDLLASLNTPRLTAISWEFAGGATTGMSSYSDRDTLAAGEILTIVANSESELPDQLILRGRLNGEPWEKTIALDGNARADASFIPRFWAQRHLEELLKDGQEHRDEIVRLSKKYDVATPFTSLIVLENDAMYKEYKVEKGRKDHWAAYPASDEIPVVHEPQQWHAQIWSSLSPIDESQVTTAPKTVEEILGTLLPAPSSSAHQWGRLAPAPNFRGDPETDRFFPRTRSLGIEDYELSVDPGITGSWDNGVKTISPYIAPGRVYSKYSGKRVWGGHGGVRLFFGDLGLKRDGIRFNQEFRERVPTLRDLPLNGRLFRNVGGYLGRDQTASYYKNYGRGDGLGSPSFYGRGLPLLYDPANLAHLVPGLDNSSTDHASAVEIQLGREKLGSITPEAAALVRAAESQRKPVRIGETITTPDGRMKSRFTTPTYLKQETISDGKNWFHIYRELGIATRRPVTPSNLAAIQGSVPHWPPSFNELEARWDVTLGAMDEGKAWFEIILTDPDNEKKKHLLKISADGYLLGSKQIEAEKVIFAVTFRYEGNTVTIETEKGDNDSYQAVEIEVSDALFEADLGDLFVLQMPLRKPVFYQQQLAAAGEVDTKKRQQIRLHLFLSRLLDPRQQHVITGEQKDRDELIKVGDGTLAAALLFNSEHVHGSGRFITHLKATRKLLWRTGKPDDLEKFIGDWPDSLEILNLVTRSQDRRAWISLLDLPAYRIEAIHQIAYAAPRDGWEDRKMLAERATVLLIEEAKAGQPIRITTPIANFIGQLEPWHQLVTAYRDCAADPEKLGRRALFAVLDLAVQADESELEKRCFAQALKDHTPEELVRLAEIFHSHRRNQKTLELYRLAFAAIDDPSSDLLHQASLAIQSADEKTSITWQQRSLKKLHQEADVVDQQAVANRYFDLITRTIAAGDLATAGQLALESNENFPSQQHRMITYIADQYHQANDFTERWRWLSTIIDRHPNDAAAIGAIGQWYEEQRMFSEAADAFAEAHSYDSATPTWLVNRTRVLYEAGDFERADDVFSKLVSTDWAPALQRQVPAEFDIQLSDYNAPGKLTTEKPGEDWKSPGFDDSDWDDRNTWFRADQSNDPLWEKPWFARKRFQLKRQPRRVALHATIHGVKCDVYLNGVLIKRMEENGWEANGGNKPYTVILSKNALEALRVGENVLSFRCEQFGKNPRVFISAYQQFDAPGS